MSIFSKHKILVFDESVFMGKLLHSILKGFDVGRVSLCHDMAKLKTLLSHKKYDCVFCDWSNWPDPKPECLDHIRNSSDVADSHVPVIICSGQTTIHQVVECRNLGCTEFISKPIAPTHVFNKLFSALYHPRKFIESESFVGPDRRRSHDVFAGLDRRKEVSLSQNEIDNVLKGENVHPA